MLCRILLVVLLAFHILAQAPAPPATEDQAAVLWQPDSQGAEIKASSYSAAGAAGNPRLGHRLCVVVGGSQPERPCVRSASQSDGRSLVALDNTGKIVRSWGRSLYKSPHSVRGTLTETSGLSIPAAPLCSSSRRRANNSCVLR